MRAEPPSFAERILGLFGPVFVCGSLAGLILIATGIVDDTAIRQWALFAGGCLIVAFLLNELARRLTEQRQADGLKRRIRESEESNRLLRLTEATAKVGHWRVDLANDAVFWSDGTFAIHGLEPGAPPSLEQAINFYHPDDRSMVEEAVNYSRRTGQPYTFRARLVRADGEVRFTESTALVELGANREPAALFGVICDRTEDETMQRDLRQARNDAHAMAQTKSAFLAKMSHEIRTPMNGVMGFAELLSHGELTDEQKRQVGLILESGRSLQTLLNDILDLSKIEARRMEIRSCPLDLRHLVARACQLVEPLAHEKAISVDHDIATDVPPHVLLDGLRVRQILGNLLSNAVRFTEAGSISVSARRAAHEIEIVVSDTGIGMSKMAQTTIFDAFAQEQLKDARNHGGTGLGLAISRQLAELMGGSLTVESDPGKGSAFTLRLPMIAVDSPEPDDTRLELAAENPCESCRCRILLAEDYDINQELICEMGQRLGLSFEVAVDGREAVEKVLAARTEDRPYSLVLMDLQMPRLDGLDAARAIRDAGIGENALPIIALTANAFADDAEACLAAGMQEHIAKPIELARLQEAMRRWLKGFAICGPGTNRNAEDLSSRSRAAEDSSGSRRYCRRF